MKKYMTCLVITFLFSQSEIMTVDNIKVEGEIKLNFSREKFINKAFLDSFDILKSKILLTRDLNKLGNLQIKEIKKIVKSFQLIDEKYDKKKYNATFKVIYDDEKVKKLLEEKSISFSNPDEISVVFFPMLFVDNEFVNFKNNTFYIYITQLNYSYWCLGIHYSTIILPSTLKSMIL